MHLFPVLVILSSLLPDYRVVAIYVNNAHHMTVERATTPRQTKRFRILDAETGKPVAAARVVAVHDFDWMDDWVLRGTTDAEGIAEFRLAKRYLHLLHAHVSAERYLTRDSLYFGDGAREPGTGWLSDDPVDIHVYRAPEATTGLRVPADFRGPLVYRFGPTKYDFPFPPNFPAGQRVWWTDVKPGVETVVEQAPRLGFQRGNGNPFHVVWADGPPIPMPEPGAEAEGVAAWRVGTRTPDGPWSREEHVIVIGDRGAALATAKDMWRQHGNGRTGFILNGWLRIVSPQTKLSDAQPNRVTRVGLDR